MILSDFLWTKESVDFRDIYGDILPQPGCLNSITGSVLIKEYGFEVANNLISNQFPEPNNSSCAHQVEEFVIGNCFYPQFSRLVEL